MESRTSDCLQMIIPGDPSAERGRLAEALTNRIQSAFVAARVPKGVRRLEIHLPLGITEEACRPSHEGNWHHVRLSVGITTGEFSVGINDWHAIAPFTEQSLGWSRRIQYSLTNSHLVICCQNDQLIQREKEGKALELLQVGLSHASTSLLARDAELFLLCQSAMKRDRDRNNREAWRCRTPHHPCLWST